MKNSTGNNRDTKTNPQTGGALLSAVATAGVVMVLVQGTVFYKAKESSKFIANERNKVTAAQMAEAGIEDNIAELGGRELTLQPHMQEYVTFQNKPLGGGIYTTTLTVQGMGNAGDTVNLTSVGSAAGKSSTIQAKMRVRHFLDSSLTPVLISAPETTYTYNTVVTYDTTVTTTQMDPNNMPALNTTPAYDACMGSSAKKCDICHLPGGNVDNRHVQNVSKPSINTHISHHGDYVTTDGTCDVYNPQETLNITSNNVVDTVMTITDNNIYDTVVVIDTLTKIQILIWR
jgi:hypothetical protein